MISVIMPTYNRAYIIERAINSIIQQTYEDFELIVVDDGSKDETEKVVNSICDNRIKYIFLQENRGACYARNYGLRYSKGDYITFLDSDNTWDPLYLEKCVKKIENYNADIVSCRIKRIKEIGKIFAIDPRAIEQNKEKYDFDKFDAVAHFHFIAGIIDTNALFMKRHVYEQVGGFDEGMRRFQDWEYTCRIMSYEKYKIKFITDCLVTTYLQKDSITNNSKLMCDSYIKIFNKYIDKMRKYKSLIGFIVHWIKEVSSNAPQERRKIYPVLQGKLSGKEIIEVEAILKREGHDALPRIERKEVVCDEVNQEIFIFPYHLFPAGSDVLIYGAGNVGRCFYKQVRGMSYINVVGIVDKNYAGKKIDNVIVGGFADISKYSFDYILIAIKDYDTVKKVKDDLCIYGIKSNCIKWDGEVYDYEKWCEGLYFKFLKFNHNKIKVDESEIQLKREKRFLKIDNEKICAAVALRGSLGDYIIEFTLVEELRKLCPNIRIDIYQQNPNPNHRPALEAVCYKQPNVVYIGTFDEYRHKQYQYDLSIQLAHFITFDYYDEKRMKGLCPALASRLADVKAGYKDFCGDIKSDTNGIFLRRAAIWGKTRYDTLGHNGIFQTGNARTTLYLNDCYRVKYEKLNLGDYITVGCGTGKNLSVKQWPEKYYEKLILMIKKEYPHFKVVELGTKDLYKFKNADVHIMGESLELVKYLLLNSKLHIDSEGGLVHMATHLGTKCVVLFGPTPIEFYGYKTNVNLSAHVCVGCYQSSPNSGIKCLRGFKEPLCMTELTPQMVFEKVVELLGTMNNIGCKRGV